MALLIPSFLSGLLISRPGLVNQFYVKYRSRLFLRLSEIELETKDEYGLLDLTKNEREIYKIS